MRVERVDHGTGEWCEIQFGNSGTHVVRPKDAIKLAKWILELWPEAAVSAHDDIEAMRRCPLAGITHHHRCEAYPGRTVCVMCPCYGRRVRFWLWLERLRRWLPRIFVALFLVAVGCSMTGCGPVHNGAHTIARVEQAVRDAAPGGVYAVTEDGARLTALTPYEGNAAFSAWYKGSPCTTFIVTNAGEPVPWSTALRRFLADAEAHGALKASRLEVLGYFSSWTKALVGASGSGLIGIMPLATWCAVEPWICEQGEAQ